MTKPRVNKTPKKSKKPKNPKVHKNPVTPAPSDTNATRATSHSTTTKKETAVEEETAVKEETAVEEETPEEEDPYDPSVSVTSDGEERTSNLAQKVKPKDRCPCKTSRGVYWLVQCHKCKQHWHTCCANFQEH